MAGRDWYDGFMKRHPFLSLRTPEQTSINRAKGFCKEMSIYFFVIMNEFVLKQHSNLDQFGIWMKVDLEKEKLSPDGEKKLLV